MLNGHLLGGDGKEVGGRLPKWGHRMPIGEVDEVVSELRNHYKVLDGILCPLYSGEAASCVRQKSECCGI